MEDPFAEARARRRAHEEEAAGAEAAEQQRLDANRATIEGLLVAAVEQLNRAGVAPRKLRTTFVGNYPRTLLGTVSKKRERKREKFPGAGWVIGVSHQGGGDMRSYTVYLVLTPRARLMSSANKDSWLEGGGSEATFDPSCSTTWDAPGRGRVGSLVDLLAWAVDDLIAGAGWDPDRREIDL